MAKIRVMSNQRRVGRVGDTTYYVRDGEQIARQSRNNSNYGEMASRTEAQQRRRVKWANLVNFYKACSYWMPKAFENVKPGQTMYNKFMSLNINESIVGLTKDMAASGCSVVERFQVAKGSLPMIEISRGDESFTSMTSIAITQAITADTTIGQLATDIIANNADFIEGDNLAFVNFINAEDAQQYPFTRSVYKEITLDSSSTKLLSEVFPVGTLGKTLNGYLGVDDSHQDPGWVEFTVIHTRKVAGSLKVSTSFIFYEYNQLVDKYSGEQWIQTCIDSYGVDQEVPLDPSFPDGAITSVTANGTVIEPGAVLSGSQTVRIYGNAVGSSAVQLRFNDTPFAPLAHGEGYDEYLIGDNGTVRIYSNGSLYLSFSVDDIVVPAEAPFYMEVSQRATRQASSPAVNRRKWNRTNCANYPYVKTEELPYFGVRIGNSSKPFQDFANLAGNNCTLARAGESDYYVYFTADITNAEAPAYVTYKGFIVAVFNYSV